MTSCTKAVQTRINCLSLEHFLISFSHGKVYFCLRINSFYFQLATAIRPWWERPCSSRCFWTQTVVFCTTTSYSLPNASQTRCQKNSKSATSSTQGQISLGINLKTICYSCLKSSFLLLLGRSEANDLAIRLARVHTKKKDLIVLDQLAGFSEYSNITTRLYNFNDCVF